MVERAVKGINIIPNDRLLLPSGLASNLQIGPGSPPANIPVSWTYRRGLWSLASLDRSLAGWGIDNVEGVPTHGAMPNFLAAWGVLGTWNGTAINQAAEFGVGFELQYTGRLTFSYYGAKPSGVASGGRMIVSVYGPGVDPHQDFTGHTPIARPEFVDSAQRWTEHAFEFYVSQPGRYAIVFVNDRQNVDVPNVCIVMPTLSWPDVQPSDDVSGHLDSPQQLVADANTGFPRIQFTLTRAGGVPLQQGAPIHFAIRSHGLATFDNGIGDYDTSVQDTAGHVVLDQGKLRAGNLGGTDSLIMRYRNPASDVWLEVNGSPWPFEVRQPRYQVALQSPSETQLSALVDRDFPAMTFVATNNNAALPSGTAVTFTTVNQGADVLFSNGNHESTEPVADNQGHVNLPLGRLHAGRQAGGAELKANIGGQEAGSWHLTVQAQAADRYQVTLQSPPEAQLNAQVAGDFPAMTFIAKRNDVALPRGETVTFATVSQDADVQFSDGSHEYAETVADDQGHVNLPPGRLHAGGQVGGARLKAIIDNHDAGAWQLTVRAATSGQRTIRINPESISMPDLHLFHGQEISLSVLDAEMHRPIQGAILTAHIQKNGTTVSASDGSVPRFNNNGTFTVTQFITADAVTGIGHTLNIQAGNQSGEYSILFESDNATERSLPLIVTAVDHLEPTTRNESAVAETVANQWWYFTALDSQGRPAGQQQVDFTIDDPSAQFEDGSSFASAYSAADTGRVWVPTLHVNGGPRSFNITVDSYSRGLRAAARLTIEVRPRQTAHSLAFLEAPDHWPVDRMGEVIEAGGAGRVRAMAADDFPMLSGQVSFTLEDTDHTGTQFVESNPTASIGYDGKVPIPAIRLGNQGRGSFKILASMGGAGVTAEQRYQLG
ncbi:hypothetical protein [Paludibacterium purpuratum]|uniref:Uncharacterized protein n=1 Tax=Paludibacterium purpuratum TaxID=1144873 RepID=A0A4R7B254_9NEIS|nr:hypothetical protein [Paludibacterium purpuratum]TDR73913.1 hypothetical protein DFP86_112117 [Paludibacterium purpuratum]